jgi:hypothetical protein
MTQAEEESGSQVTPQVAQIDHNAELEEPSTSCVMETKKGTTSSPADVRPLPQAGPRKNNTKRQKITSVSVTDTPVKAQIENAAAAAASRASSTKSGRKKSKARRKTFPAPPETSDSEDESVVPVESDSDEELVEEVQERDMDMLR